MAGKTRFSTILEVRQAYFPKRIAASGKSSRSVAKAGLNLALQVIEQMKQELNSIPSKSSSGKSKKKKR